MLVTVWETQTVGAQPVGGFRFGRGYPEVRFYLVVVISADGLKIPRYVRPVIVGLTSKLYNTSP